MKTPKPIELSIHDLEHLIERLEQGSFGNADKQILIGILESYRSVIDLLAEKNVSIMKLRKMIFGKKTESLENMLKNLEPKTGNRAGGKQQPKKPQSKGHGRNSVQSFKSAEKIPVPHEELKNGDDCPKCTKGKVYRMKRPKIVIRFTGDSPLKVKVYELEKYRCNLCGVIFCAKLHADAGLDKYDNKARAIIPILRYGSGFPLNRLQNLQGSLGCPFPVANQWQIISELADKIEPIHRELVRQAAQGEIIHNDDTNMKILSLMNIKKELYEKQKRTGIFTSGFLSINGIRKIALFFSGRNHAGENMMQLLRQRQDQLGPPIQMCDALSRNLPKDFKTLLAHCLSHARRNFTDLILLFPEECIQVIKLLAEVYRHDEFTKNEKMSGRERLLYHKKHSAKVMWRLHVWLRGQFKTKHVEPNSSLGKAITYMLTHWETLTLFLRVEKAPIDNNICEQALKMTILHRKNSLFYKNERGATIGDMFMSLIHTCNLAHVNPFEYFVAIQKYVKELRETPAKWLPWNYQENLETMPVPGSNQ